MTPHNCLTFSFRQTSSWSCVAAQNAAHLSPTSTMFIHCANRMCSIHTRSFSLVVGWYMWDGICVSSCLQVLSIRQVLTSPARVSMVSTSERIAWYWPKRGQFSINCKNHPALERPYNCEPSLNAHTQTRSVPPSISHKCPVSLLPKTGKPSPH